MKRFKREGLITRRIDRTFPPRPKYGANGPWLANLGSYQKLIKEQFAVNIAYCQQNRPSRELVRRIIDESRTLSERTLLGVLETLDRRSITQTRAKWPEN